MNDALYDFEWTVAPSYEWHDWLDRAGWPIVVPSISLESASAVELAWNQSREQDKQSGPVLCPAAKDGSSVRRYRPMQREHAALFKEFGEVDYRSREEVLDFARRYGLLGVSSQIQSVNYRGQDGEPRLHYVAGEPLLDWSFEICLMREGRVLAGRSRSAKDSHRLKWLFDRNLQHVQGRVSFNQSGEPRLVQAPLNLVAAMWLQFALAITGEKRFVACEFCRRMFEISAEQTGLRSQREFCTDSCKTKDYRKRKRAALSLWASGATLAEISEKARTDRVTVRSWLATAKNRTRKAPAGSA